MPSQMPTQEKLVPQGNPEKEANFDVQADVPRQHGAGQSHAECEQLQGAHWLRSSAVTDTQQHNMSPRFYFC